MCNPIFSIRSTQLACLATLLAATTATSAHGQERTPYQQMLRASVKYRFLPISEVIEETDPEVAQEDSRGPSFYGPSPGPGPVQLDGTVDPGFAPPDKGFQPPATDDGDPDGDAFPNPAGVPEFNLQARVSEQWLNHFLSRGETREGEVRDNILGADVFGRQTTQTQLRVNFVPHSEGARIDFLLQGRINSQTQGVTPQATIYTLGNHDFQASKEVLYDGKMFLVKPATMCANAHNQSVGAQTQYSNIPILGRIADRYAVREAERRKPESEAIASQRVLEKALPEFSKTVDAKLAQANRRLESEVREKLKRASLLPDREAVSSTDTHLYYTALYRTKAESGEGAQPPFGNAGLELHVHESLLNGIIDRLQLEGQTFTDQELFTTIRTMVSLAQKMVTGQGNQGPVDPGETGESPVQGEGHRILLDDDDPVRFRFANGKLFVQLRVGFEPQAGEAIPIQMITIPFQARIEGQNVVLTPGEITVDVTEHSRGKEPQLLRAGVIRHKLEALLHPVTASRRLTLPVEPGQPPVTLSLDAISAERGWLSVSVD